MKRPNISAGPWTINKAVDYQNCGIRVHAPDSPKLGALHIYSKTPHKHELAKAIASLPDLLQTMELIWANAAESPEWIRARLQPAMKKAGYTF